MKNILSKASMKFMVEKFKEEKKKIVFTNGVFDIIHSGHIDYLIKAKELGDILIVGLNSDSSVRRIKGEKRPIINQTDRAFVLSNLKPVDYVVLFEEDTPLEIIKAIVPDVLVKGADWSLDKIVGSDVVLNNGGEVKNISFVNDQSTSRIVDLILSRYSN
jgi:D-glycero-beta-D-manno-heptose 1-phosphate adenylyltransferase